jgi:Ca2+-binding EF-hand superfamily protein
VFPPCPLTHRPKSNSHTKNIDAVIGDRAGAYFASRRLEEAKRSYTTGDGRFNWIVFCDQVERARKQSWGEASRIKSAKLFNELDKDGSGRLGRDELRVAVSKLGIKVSGSELETMFDSFDEDGDGNLSYP